MEVGVLDAFEAQDGVSDGFAHAAYFAVAAFCEDDLDPGVSTGSGAESFDVQGLCEAIVEGDAVLEFA